MTSKEVEAIIYAQINGDWGRSNAHGCNLKDCLVEPIKMNFNGFNPDDKFELWLVLEEDPISKDGYKIVYDEEEDSFGLAIIDQADVHVFIGLYGSFPDTFDRM